jgi:hypothetical protein
MLCVRGAAAISKEKQLVAAGERVEARFADSPDEGYQRRILKQPLLCFHRVSEGTVDALIET